MLGMRACLPCHIPYRWSRNANWIWPVLAFGFVPRRSGNEIMRMSKIESLRNLSPLKIEVSKKFVSLLHISAGKFMVRWCLFASKMNWPISSLFASHAGGERVIDVPFPFKRFNFALILNISVATAEIKMLAKAAKETPSLGDASFHIVGLPVCTVSVFGKKSDAVYGFVAYFCAVLRFSDPPYAPSLQ